MCASPKILEAKTTDIFLSSNNALTTGCGQHNTPYVLKAKPGQKINISLTDFSFSNENVIDNSDICVSYGYILDSKSDDVITICGNNRRFKHLYSSTGNSVQILLETSSLKNKFLLQFKGLNLNLRNMVYCRKLQ